jgi:hypothetical protein
LSFILALGVLAESAEISLAPVIATVPGEDILFLPNRPSRIHGPIVNITITTYLFRCG